MLFSLFEKRQYYKVCKVEMEEEEMKNEVIIERK